MLQIKQNVADCVPSIHILCLRSLTMDGVPPPHSLYHFMCSIIAAVDHGNVNHQAIQVLLMWWYLIIVGTVAIRLPRWSSVVRTTVIKSCPSLIHFCFLITTPSIGVIYAWTETNVLAIIRFFKVVLFTSLPIVPFTLRDAH